MTRLTSSALTGRPLTRLTWTCPGCTALVGGRPAGGAAGTNWCCFRASWPRTRATTQLCWPTTLTATASMRLEPCPVRRRLGATRPLCRCPPVLPLHLPHSLASCRAPGTQRPALPAPACRELWHEALDVVTHSSIGHVRPYEVSGNLHLDTRPGAPHPRRLGAHVGVRSLRRVPAAGRPNPADPLPRRCAVPRRGAARYCLLSRARPWIVVSTWPPLACSLLHLARSGWCPAQTWATTSMRL